MMGRKFRLADSFHNAVVRCPQHCLGIVKIRADILQAAADELSITWRRQDLEELNTVSDLVSYVENRV